MAEDNLRQTPLHDFHKELGARIVPFAGWEMPVQYSGILEETRVVRNGVGLFDISHMGRIYVRGAGAESLLQKVTSNDVAALESGQAQYSLLTNENGGIIDDIIVYKSAEERFAVVLNASNTKKDLDWIHAHNTFGPHVVEITDLTAMIAVQGPKAVELVAMLANINPDDVPRFHFVDGHIQGGEALILRTGYTGEDGFEVIVHAENATAVWRALQEGGGVPCGLGARDALRIEAGYPLYGHEIDDDTTPVEAALMWAVKPEKGEFIGSEKIAAVKENGAGRKLVGLTLTDRIVPRQGYTVIKDGSPIGTVTSGVFSPTVGHSIAMAYIDDPHNKTGTMVEIEIRANRISATVVPKKNLLAV